jgi:hypothetical protein
VRTAQKRREWELVVVIKLGERAEVEEWAE